MTHRTRRLIPALLFATLCAAPFQSARAALLPWEQAWGVTFDNTVPLGPVAPVFDQVEPIWYCGAAYANAETCPATSGPLQAAFRFRFNLPSNVTTPYKVGNLFVQADDYYALYVNGTLLGSNWLDDLARDNGVPVPDFYDFASLLKLGASNEILLFACDGVPPGTKGSRTPPGSTPDGGWDGCVAPQARVNHYVLLQGGVEVRPDGGFGAPVFSQSLASHSFFGPGPHWEVSSIPEPATWALVIALLPGFVAARRRTLGVTSHRPESAQ